MTCAMEQEAEISKIELQTEQKFILELQMIAAFVNNTHQVCLLLHTLRWIQEFL